MIRSGDGGKTVPSIGRWSTVNLSLSATGRERARDEPPSTCPPVSFPKFVVTKTQLVLISLTTVFLQLWLVGWLAPVRTYFHLNFSESASCVHT